MPNRNDGTWGPWVPIDGGVGCFKLGNYTQMLWAPSGYDPDKNHVHVKMVDGVPVVCSVKTDGHHDWRHQPDPRYEPHSVILPQRPPERKIRHLPKSFRKPNIKSLASAEHS